MIHYPRLTIVTVVLACATAMSHASGHQDNDAVPGRAAKISLIQAITAAEHHTPGTPVRAEYEHTKSGWAYDVEIVNGKQTFEVRVNADTGAVISSAKDKVDHDDARDKKD